MNSWFSLRTLTELGSARTLETNDQETAGGHHVDRWGFLDAEVAV